MTTSDSHHERYMRLALRLAARARGQTAPNPMVGAVVVHRNRIVGKGYHHQAGEPHAEVLALEQAGKKARGATLYVTLEPCSHSQKRTAPCLPLILASQVKHVVIATPDPNPQVNGRSIRLLKKQNIAVEVGCLQQEADRLNEFYNHWIQTNRPFAFLKAAMTLDGKIATAKGESKWITGPEARALVHTWRSQVDAVMIGIETLLQDNPYLTARKDGKTRSPLFRHQPLRIVMDSHLRIPLGANLLGRGTPSKKTSRHLNQSLIITTNKAPKFRVRRLQSRGVPMLMVPIQQGRPSLSATMEQLGKMGISSVMIEGGGELNAAALHAGVVQQVRMFIAPKLLGGQNSKSVIGGLSPTRLVAAHDLIDVRVQPIGRDVLIEADLTTQMKKRSSW